MTDRPTADMNRIVPGWRWLEGTEAQELEWAALRKDFYRWMNLKIGEVALMTTSKQFNEADRTVILRIEAKIVKGTVSFGSVA